MAMNKKYSKIIYFENHKLGLYNIKTFLEDWQDKPRMGIKEKRCRIVKLGNENVLEVTIPKGTCGNGGSFWRLNFPRSFTDVTFEYDVLFGDNFDFVRGGKLPGLGGGNAKGFGATEENYQNGFSARLMWRETEFEKLQSIKKPLQKKIKMLKEIIESQGDLEKRKSMFSKLNLKNEIINFEWLARDLIKEPHKAFLVQYIYYPDKKTTMGDDKVYSHKGRKIFVEPKKWYNIKMRIKLSQNPNNKDKLIAWINGRKCLDEKIHLRKKKSYGIDQVIFSLFFGGQDASHATHKKEKVYFRKFKIQEN